MLLGAGQEGEVRLVNGFVEKQFHIDALTDENVAWLKHLLLGVMPFLPEPSWSKSSLGWLLRYPWFETAPVDSISIDEARQFLLFCLSKNLVCANIKRSNFRRRQPTGLTFVDIGAWILPMNVDYFRDSTARLFAICKFQWSDDEIRRRSHELREPGFIECLPGFTDFYAQLLQDFAQSQWHSVNCDKESSIHASANDVTLLIKACAMDAEYLTNQLTHIVEQLSRPLSFKERVLLIDPFRGPFLRQHSVGNFDEVVQIARSAIQNGLIDRFLIAPDESDEIARINNKWFGIPCHQSHSIRGIPVTPQLWGFDQISTRYVLQCDCDIIVGRKTHRHNYLTEMLNAVQKEDVLGVAFNIARNEGSPILRYDAPPGEFVPEVRCGLLDLTRIRSCQPLPNEIQAGHLALSWYRSLQTHQQKHGLRTLRGGDPRTFFVHPQNDWKTDKEALCRVRDLIGQGQFPSIQGEKWDLTGGASDWRYPNRNEDIIFLLKGRNTPLKKIQRCLDSLKMQRNQDFGIILIDDASEGVLPFLLPDLLGKLYQRSTLIRHTLKFGRMPNFLLTISQICINPESLIVVLDQDDALIHVNVVERLRHLYDDGRDVILGAMYRPDKPTKLYHPDFCNPRSKWGGEVWIHLRSFRKRLFDEVPLEALRKDGVWIEECTDYAIMIPIVELASSPFYIPEYLYFHERSTPRTPERRAIKDLIIRDILAKPCMNGLEFGERS